MNIDQVRDKSIVSYLKSQGKKSYGSGKIVSFLSPIASETQPSFKVDTVKNRFRCYSSGKSGSIIDLVMATEHVDFKGACSILNDGVGSSIEEYTPPKIIEQPAVKIHSVEPVTNTDLIKYFVEKRKISEHIVKTYCDQVSFSFPYSEKNNVMIYTAIGFKSDLGGYELRNSYMKIANSPKCFTTIIGDKEDDANILLFEGWIDFLSYLMYWNIDTPPYRTFVLNGTGQLHVLKPMLDNKKVSVYVDLDKAGDGIIEELDNCTVMDKRYLFSFYNDFNEMLQG